MHILFINRVIFCFIFTMSFMKPDTANAAGEGETGYTVEEIREDHGGRRGRRAGTERMRINVKKLHYYERCKILTNKKKSRIIINKVN